MLKNNDTITQLFVFNNFNTVSTAHNLQHNNATYSGGRSLPIKIISVVHSMPHRSI